MQDIWYMTPVIVQPPKESWPLVEIHCAHTLSLPVPLPFYPSFLSFLSFYMYIYSVCIYVCVYKFWYLYIDRYQNLLRISFLKDIYYFSMCIDVWSIYTSVHHVLTWYRQRSDWSCGCWATSVGAGSRTQVLWRAANALTTEPSLWLLKLALKS